MKKVKPVVIILSVTSDIGMVLTKRYLKDGFRVIGTYRKSRDELSELKRDKSCSLFSLDITNEHEVKNFAAKLKALRVKWNTFVSCVGEPRPLTAFFKTDFGSWTRSVDLNATMQLRVLHALYPLRDKKKMPNVVFFAAGGVNKAVVNFSSYTIGKIMLIKMCEYLDAEEKNLNIFTVGPGWTRTKTHELILKDPGTSHKNREETLKFLKHGRGTDIDYIYECIRWLSGAGKNTASGRNFAIAHDPLEKGKREKLVKTLGSDSNMYKLRRYGSDL